MDKIASRAPLRLGPAPGHAAQVYPARRPLDGEGRALLLWLHGGPFTDTAAGAASEPLDLLAEAGADVVALHYPLAPEHPFPAALHAAFDALQTLEARPGRFTGSARTALFVGGAQAGGNIAAALALMARDQQGPALAGQLLLSPMLDPRLGSASMRDGACGGRECHYAQGWKAYLGDGIGADHPYATPLNATRLGGVAPALVVSLAGHPLNDESRRYAAALRAHGVSARDLTLADLAPAGLLGPLHDFFSDATRRALAPPPA